MNYPNEGLFTACQDGLPLELVQEIFLQGSLSSSQLAYTLCLVSSWAREIALPGLYTAVSLKTEQDAERFFNTIARDSGLLTRPGTWPFQPRTVITAIRYHTSEMVTSIFGQCVANVTHLAMTSRSLMSLLINMDYGGQRITMIRQILHDRGFGLDVFLTDYLDRNVLALTWPAHYDVGSYKPGLGQTNPYASLFNHITRLRLAEAPQRNSHDPQTYIQFFTSLTHIAIPVGFGRRDLDFVAGLSEHPTLQVIVLLVPSDVLANLTAQGDDWSTPLQRQDLPAINILAVETRTDAETLADSWGKEARGGQSIWDTFMGQSFDAQ